MRPENVFSFGEKQLQKLFGENYSVFSGNERNLYDTAVKIALFVSKRNVRRKVKFGAKPEIDNIFVEFERNLFVRCQNLIEPLWRNFWWIVDLE